MLPTKAHYYYFYWSLLLATKSEGLLSLSENCVSQGRWPIYYTQKIIYRFRPAQHGAGRSHEGVRICSMSAQVVG